MCRLLNVCHAMACRDRSRSPPAPVPPAPVAPVAPLPSSSASESSDGQLMSSSLPNDNVMWFVIELPRMHVFFGQLLYAIVFLPNGLAFGVSQFAWSRRLQFEQTFVCRGMLRRAAEGLSRRTRIFESRSVRGVADSPVPVLQEVLSTESSWAFRAILLFVSRCCLDAEFFTIACACWVKSLSGHLS